jgi:hypothetical protein
MAHFKRMKPRLRTNRGYSTRAGNKRFRQHHACWMCWWPAWWDIIYHRRRRRSAAIEGKILRGEVDADATVWPVGKKPHAYYW